MKQRGGDYDRVKNAIAERMWEQTLALYPQLKDKVRFIMALHFYDAMFGYRGNSRGSKKTIPCHVGVHLKDLKGSTKTKQTLTCCYPFERFEGF